MRRRPITVPAVCATARWMCAVLVLALAPATASRAELVIGLIPELNVFRQMERYEPIADYVRERLGLEIRFTILPRYGNILDSFSSQSMDGAFWGSFVGGLAIQKLGIEPLARPIWLDGTSTYHGYVFVRKDSGIRNASDMKGKTIAFVDRATTAGYVFPLAYLREQGVRDVESHFGEHYFAGSHDATIVAVLEGKADVGCAKNTIYSRVAAEDPRVGDDLVILATSPKVPSNALGVRSDLDPAIKEKLRSALMGMDSDPRGREVLAAFGAHRFIRTTAEDYSPVFETAERAAIDLKNYQYVND